MTDNQHPVPTGWVVMEQFKGGPQMVMPAWQHRDSDGDSVVIIGHPGGVIINGHLDSDTVALEMTARCILAAIEITNEQRMRGQAAVQDLLDRIKPEGDPITLADLIETAVKESEERSKRATETQGHLSELFSSLLKSLDDSDKPKPDSPPEQDGKS